MDYQYEYLLEVLKNELYITWDDNDTNKKLIRIISNAIPTMNFKLGAEINYTTPGMEQNLFINYCVYVYNNCVNEFDQNYFNEIMQIRTKWEIENEEE